MKENIVGTFRGYAVSLAAFYLIFSCSIQPGIGSPYSIGQVAVSASRISGVAPLMVHFEVACTSEEFHTRDYAWDFGDASSGTWGTDRKPKNSAKGAIAAHVFEEPGRYDVTVTVKNASGGMNTATVKITVADPDATYAGTATTCVNAFGDADFSGAPARARRISTNDLSKITEYATAGSRILFKRGTSWTTAGLDTWPENGGPVTIGAYGPEKNPDASGRCENAPRITVTSGNFFPLDYKQDWRIMDLNFADPTRTCGFTGGVTDFRRILFLRIKATGFDVPLGWSHWNNPDGKTQIDQMALVSCDLSDAKSNVSYIGSERLVVLGNTFRNAHESHVLRVWQAYKGVISDNISSGSSLDTNTGRHALKLHGPGESELVSTGWDRQCKRTEYTILSDNLFGSSGPWPVAIGPQDGGKDERLSNLIFERNRYVAEFGDRSQLSNAPSEIFRFTGRQITVRNNVVDGSNYGAYFTGISIPSEGIAPVPADVWIYNNTIYKSGAANGQNWVGITVGDRCESVAIRNNLVSFPSGSGGHAVIVDGGLGTVQSNNIMNGAVVFADPDNAFPLNRAFFLNFRSLGAIDKGTEVNSVLDDYAGNSRPSGMTHDIGAFEFTGD